MLGHAMRGDSVLSIAERDQVLRYGGLRYGSLRMSLSFGKIGIKRISSLSISRLFMDYLIGLCKCLIFHSLRKMATVLDLPQVHTHTHMHIVT